MKFQQSGCLWAAKRTGRPWTSAETVERVREKFVRSPQKSTHPTRRSPATLPIWRPCPLQCQSSRSFDWARFSKWLSSSSLASTVTWPNHLRFFSHGLHQGSCVRAPYATWFTTAATKDRGGSRCFRPPDIATCVAGTWLQDLHLQRHHGWTYRARVR